jgi:putative transposase
VLGWVIGAPCDLAELARRFAPLRYARTLDRSGYVRFRHWRMYGERSLPQQPALVWLSDETLTVGYGEEPLAYYTVKVDRRGELIAVTEPRLLPTSYQSVQARLWAWTPNSDEWQLALRVPPRGRRRRRRQEGVQTQLIESTQAG